VTSAVAVGVFDGVHLGHAQILAAARRRADALGGPCVVVSFDPHPDLVLAKTFHAQPPLTPLPEKRARLAALGADRVEILPFTRELAALEPEAFVETHLVHPYGMRALVVGENFTLGRARTGNVDRLRAIGAASGFEVEPVPLLSHEGGPVTSTRIRGLLGEGRVAEAARLLGRRYTLSGVVVTGDGIGRTLGVPTANLRLEDEKLVPAHGIYATQVRIGDETAWHPGALSIGVRPTFGGKVPTIEVHLLDWSGDLVGRPLEVAFQEWVRPELEFESTEALVAAMRRDLDEIRRLTAPLAQTPDPAG
jgi:riboflavin kinase/FMN adenylyltransferase